MTTSAATTTAPYAELAAAVRGELIMPGDPGYDQARAVYNAMIDKYPAAIARCHDTADVIACVRFAREHGLAIAVRGGGHNAAGLGVWDDALVIDLSLLRSTTVDPQNHTVGPTPDAPGETSTTRPSRSAWPRRPASWPPPAWPG
jgi:FAD/FMN-containing dehydrogenase